MRLHPVILCGGPGARLWPASTAGRPKPFLELVDGGSSFQRTLQRLSAIEGAAPPLIITGADHAAAAAAQMEAWGLAGEILVEPAARDSAAAAFAGALWVERIAPQGLALLVAADHHIPDVGAFIEGVERAIPAAEQGAIVVFGLEPARAAPEFGYVLPAAPHAGVAAVAAFVEKPSAERAAELIDRGALWNSGNFLFRADVMVAEAERLAPQVLEAVRAALPSPDGEPPLRLGACFTHAPRISLDRAIMEKTGRAAVTPVAYAWSDLGSWEAVWAASEQNEDGVSARGATAAVEVRNSLLRAEGGARIVAFGVENLAIVANGADVLVTALHRSGELKTALDRAPLAPATRLPALAGALSSWWREQALPVWWCFGADLAGGGFHDQLRPDLAPTAAPKRLRVQARQAMVFAEAGRAGWPGPWRAALDHGLAALRGPFRRRDGLLLPTAPTRSESGEAAAVLYDQAFGLLALAAAARVLPEQLPGLEAEAVALQDLIEGAFGHRSDGFAADEAGHAFLSDPLMHLLEAALAWVEVGREDRWAQLAARLTELFETRLFIGRLGAVREAYDVDWNPIGSDDGAEIEPGHQFEWAYLLARSRGLISGGGAHPLSALLLAAGERGVEGGLARDGLEAGFRIAQPGARLWPQCERLRAWVCAGGENHEADANAAEAAGAIQRYLTIRPPGLWDDRPLTPGAAASPALASTLYHLTGAIRALETRFDWARPLDI